MSDKKYHQYFSSRPKLSITMPNGNRIYFTAGQYVTDNESEIEFLDDQIRQGHQMIYVKPEQKTVTQEQLDPLAAVKKKAIEEFLAKQAEQADPNRDMGNYKIEQNVQTSKTLAQITAPGKSK